MRGMLIESTAIPQLSSKNSDWIYIAIYFNDNCMMHLCMYFDLQLPTQSYEIVHDIIQSQTLWPLYRAFTPPRNFLV
jgi:hypothetical protein